MEKNSYFLNNILKTTKKIWDPWKSLWKWENITKINKLYECLFTLKEGLLDELDVDQPFVIILKTLK